MIHALFKSFGSKYKAAKYYPHPKYDTIIEPFAGTAAYSLHHNEKNVILYETHPRLHALWKWLIEEATEEDMLNIPLSRDLPVGSDIRMLDLSDGQKLLLKHWQYTNNTSDCWKISHFLNGGWTESVRKRVSKDVAQIKHWKIIDKDGMQAFKRKRAATWFVDPPYQYIGTTAYGNEPLDYDLLGKVCQQVKGQVIACEAIGKNGETPIYLPFSSYQTKSANSIRLKSGINKAQELIWLK